MSTIRHFRDLRVYRAAFEAAVRIQEISSAWPKEERFSLTDQVRRSSRAVCACTAEAWRKRRYPAHFTSKLSDADSEAAEPQSWLEFALHFGYITRADFEQLDAAYEGIAGGLVRMMTEPDKWCGTASLVKEEQADYVVDL
jgi:four helix bundle protein